MTGKEIKAVLAGTARKFDDRTDYCTSSEFAHEHGYSEGSVRTMLKRGKITGAVKSLGQWMIPKNADVLVKKYARKDKIKTSHL